MFNIGRNDECICGSGKKYKKCCMPLLEMSEKDRFRSWKLRALEIMADHPQGRIITETLFSTQEFINNMDLSGFCYGTTAILYVLLKEQGIDANPCVGEVARGISPFNHSWIEIDKLPYDMAIYKPLKPELALPPIIKGYDVATKSPSLLVYGISSGLGDFNVETRIKTTPFKAYMDGFPGHPHGLWGLTHQIGEELGIEINIEAIKDKYKDTKWLIK